MGSEEVDAPVLLKSKNPHGYGDPDDKSLRKVEKNVLIKNKVRAVAKERCKDVVSEFQNCAVENGIKMAFVCRYERDVMLDCISKWFYDSELNEKMKIEYLNERSEFRRTGIRQSNIK